MDFPVVSLSVIKKVQRRVFPVLPISNPTIEVKAQESLQVAQSAKRVQRLITWFSLRRVAKQVQTCLVCKNLKVVKRNVMTNTSSAHFNRSHLTYELA